MDIFGLTLHVFFLPFSPASLAKSCLFWYGLKDLCTLHKLDETLSLGPFLERSGNFSGPKSNIQIEIKRIRARVLASKLLHFVSLTDSFIMLDAKLLKPWS